MRRVATAVVLVTLVACTAGVALTARSSAATSKPAAAAKGSATNLTVWVGWQARELNEFKKVVSEWDKKNPNVTVKVVGNVDDDKITAAIRSGNAPDVVSSFTSSNVGAYCSSGAWIDLASYLKKDKVDLSQFPKTSLYYTQYGGKRCALPLLADAYGLYYNKALFAKAGLKRPPKTMSELTAYAKKLTKKQGGKLKVVGFDPYFGFYSNFADMTNLAPSFGAKYLNAQGKSHMAADLAWSKLLRWQKKLVDWYGYSKLVRFNAGAKDEFSASNAFEIGQVAMILDGEWRVAFLKAEHPELKYGTAPMPVDDAHPELYGAGSVNGTIIGIPKGGKHNDEAWALVKYLTMNDHALAKFSNAIRNVPSTRTSAKSKELQPDPHFATFIKIFNHPKSLTSPITAAGNANLTLVSRFAVKWQAGKVKDLQAALKALDKQIDAQNAQAKTGGGVP